MMIEMKCPFCQQELNQDSPQIIECRNSSCEKTWFMYGSKELWQELIRTRKALKIAKERLKNTILDAEILATPEYLASRAKETLDEITALEQKE